MFAPCPNLTLASRRLASLQRACEGKPAFASDPVWCAIAVYRGSWETPDNKFADSVRLAMSKEELPNPIVEDATTTAGTTRDAQGDSDVSAHAGGWESSIFVTPAAGQRRSVLPPESGAAASAAQRDGGNASGRDRPMMRCAPDRSRAHFYARVSLWAESRGGRGAKGKIKGECRCGGSTAENTKRRLASRGASSRARVLPSLARAQCAWLFLALSSREQRRRISRSSRADRHSQRRAPAEELPQSCACCRVTPGAWARPAESAAARLRAVGASQLGALSARYAARSVVWWSRHG